MSRRSIDQMIDELLKKEGGYVNDPADRGGATNFGITEAVARANGYKGDMRDLPRSTAVAIYKKQYFTDPGFDRIYALSQPIAEEMFDTAVNMGVSVPGPWLQRLLNSLNERGGDLKVDGQLGPATTLALRVFLNRRGAEGERVLILGLNCMQGARYLEITEKREANKAFMYGWLLNRVGV